MKHWFWERFLPMWAKETLLQDNRCLQRENEALRAQVRELECYIRGLHRGSRRVVIQTGRSKIDN